MSDNLTLQLNVIINRVLCNVLGTITESDKELLKELTEIAELIVYGEYLDARDSLFEICHSEEWKGKVDSGIVSGLKNISLHLTGLLDPEEGLL